eukprot:TRINITY_DN57177_c0_g1_i1.p1 TRINITY_DN57177_c0_g1~~TRINITY_DN57177_c0_g1_i1.p1  ORF type:complete len:360 (+),score=27.84 TRINITY_DN57177_c0_g1_i1:26-1081(+)
MEDLAVLLSADIGGTNARFQLCKWDPKTDSFTDIRDKTYPSGDFTCLDDVIFHFLKHDGYGWDLPDQDKLSNYTGPIVHSCCVALCAPVEDDLRHAGPIVEHQPPTRWEIDMTKTKAHLQPLLRNVALINDFAAVGYGLTVMSDEDLLRLTDAPMQPTATKACVGAGSGLGMCFLTWNPQQSQYMVHASEGGMVDLRVRTKEDLELLDFLRQQFGHVTVEHLVSGNGVLNVYNWLNSLREEGKKVTLSKPAEVTQKATEGDETCLRAIKIVLRFYAEELRYSALRWMAFGGLYVVAGLVQRLLQWAKEELPTEFLNDPCMGDVLKNIPLIVCTREDLGLVGSRERAKRALQ